MDRFAFQIFGLQIAWYGIIIASAMLIGSVILMKVGKKYGYKENKLAALKIANDLMFGRSSRFFMQSIESGLITDGFDFDTQVGDGYAMSLVGNETDHIDALYELILKEIETHISSLSAWSESGCSLLRECESPGRMCHRIGRDRRIAPAGFRARPVSPRS